LHRACPSPRTAASKLRAEQNRLNLKIDLAQNFQIMTIMIGGGNITRGVALLSSDFHNPPLHVAKP
jgi:hypothetical protein